jgi:hypothetical protein
MKIQAYFGPGSYLQEKQTIIEVILIAEWHNCINY